MAALPPAQEYIVVQGSVSGGGEDNFYGTIASRLNDGWVLHGGISAAQDGTFLDDDGKKVNNFKCFQAMTRERAPFPAGLEPNSRLPRSRNPPDASNYGRHLNSGRYAYDHPPAADDQYVPTRLPEPPRARGWFGQAGTRNPKQRFSGKRRTVRRRRN
jgi:hypothetical protein